MNEAPQGIDWHTNKALVQEECLRPPARSSTQLSVPATSNPPSISNHTCTCAQTGVFGRCWLWLESARPRCARCWLRGLAMWSRCVRLQRPEVQCAVHAIRARKLGAGWAVWEASIFGKQV